MVYQNGRQGKVIDRKPNSCWLTPYSHFHCLMCPRQTKTKLLVVSPIKMLFQKFIITVLFLGSVFAQDYSLRGSADASAGIRKLDITSPIVSRSTLGEHLNNIHHGDDSSLQSRLFDQDSPLGDRLGGGGQGIVNPEDHHEDDSEDSEDDEKDSEDHKEDSEDDEKDSEDDEEDSEDDEEDSEDHEEEPHDDGSDEPLDEAEIDP